MTLEQITHDLATVDRVIYRTDIRDAYGIHGWQLGLRQPTLISYAELPTDEEWQERLSAVRANHQPSFRLSGQ